VFFSLLAHHGDRWVGTVRRDLLDRMLIVNRRLLERVPAK
jgi:hypothetical protein